MAQSGLFGKDLLILLENKKSNWVIHQINHFCVLLLKRLQICNGEQRYWNFKPECSFILSQHLRCIVCCQLTYLENLNSCSNSCFFAGLCTCFFSVFFLNVSFNRQIRLRSWKVNTFWSLEQALDFKIIL